jgi:hypothetical protein
VREVIDLIGIDTMIKGLTDDEINKKLKCDIGSFAIIANNKKTIIGIEKYSMHTKK